MSRKVLIVTLALLLLYVCIAFAGIENTKHNLSYKHQVEVCIWCHTPHTEPISVQAWNKEAKSAIYLTYGSSMAGANEEMTPNTLSKVCLSCHDGIQAYNLNIDEKTWQKSNLTQLQINQATNEIGSMRNHHIVSVTYNENSRHLRPRNASLSGWRGALIVNDLIKNGRIECSSCHDPHVSDNQFFLRHNDRGKFCYGCHGWK
ncbi:hypothetical protein JZK55_15620 [Dissulfurispira thermophila]|uniref:Doubled CXXCH motif domain-containing protein n=2 Tax=root TaxID=1 RepID=A0A7G1H1E3_9BACT|nr:cytochrome c3 family protein [Dissulfurispira thermophila]BCB96640.1 hypothetical protein JZK55_15620 [Dissulfurispira thermophila]